MPSGRVINGLMAVFRGIGSRPRVLSVEYIDSTHCDITFNENMEEISAETVSNYSISGANTLTVIDAILSNNVVRLTIDSQFISATYTVYVSNVQDLIGNPIDPLYSSASFSCQNSIYFGGINSLFAVSDETWKWNGSSFSQQTPATTPTARWWYNMTLDRVRGVSIIFGGSDAFGGLLNDTWEYDGTDWTQKAAGAVTKPEIRYGFSITFDSFRGVSVLFGGVDNLGGLLDDTWEWDGSTWVEKASGAVAKPSASASHGLAFDSNRNVSVLFGGDTTGGGVYSDETWEWAGSTWVEKATGAVTKPSARGGHSMVYDPVRQVIVLFGGVDAVDASNETWEWDGTSWTQKAAGAVTKPAARLAHVAVYDYTRGTVIIYGGTSAGAAVFYSDMWEWDGSTWTQITPVGGTMPNSTALAAMA